jgi:folate-binding protein YgfZ
VDQHHGDPVAEQRAWEAGAGAAWLDGLAVLRVTGGDRLSWLNSLTTQRMESLRPGSSAETLVLDPNGRIEHALAVVDTGQSTYLVVPAGQAPDLMAFLTAMRFTLDVSVANVSDEAAILATPGAIPGVTALGIPAPWTWDDPWPGVSDGGAAYGPVVGHPGARWRWRLAAVPHGARPHVADTLRRMGVTPVGTWALEALRIAAWRPSGAAPGAVGALPHELDWLRTAVHLNKGCYRGQETVAKVYNVGRPPRRLAMLHLDGSTLHLPAPGAALLVRGAESGGPVGTITSSGRHHVLGPIALGLVARRVPPDVELVADGVPARQEIIVPPSGFSAERPNTDGPAGLPGAGGGRGTLVGSRGRRGGAGPATGRRIGLTRGR